MLSRGLQKVDHAGYTRYILTSNPPRFNDEGRELEETEVDEEADAAAAEANPYSSIDLTGRMSATQPSTSQI